MCKYQNLIVITNRKLCQGDYLAQLEKVASLHPAALILREKDLSGEEYEKLANQVQGICETHQVPFWIHSHVEILKKLQGNRIHVSIPGLRNLLEEHAGLVSEIQISVSCHSLEDAKEAERAGASQILLGNIFETDCKKGLPGKGLDFLKEVADHVSVPVYAIGGISTANLKSVLDAGAAGGCMMSGFMRL